jgi:hypothetical protein
MESMHLEELRVVVANQRRFSVMKRLLQSGFVIFAATVTASGQQKPEAILVAVKSQHAPIERMRDVPLA